MPYSKSRARVEFEENLSRLQKLSRKASYKSSPFNYDYKLLVFQSAIFLLSASFEEYLKRQIEDLIYSYKTNGAYLKEIPINTRTFVLMTKQLGLYKSFINDGDEPKILDSLSPKNKSFELFDDNIVFTNQIEPTMILSGKKYPSSLNLKLLYNRLGISNIFDELGKRGKRNYKEVIDSFMSVRQAIAHQEAPALTFTDIERYFKDIEEVIMYLDRTTYSHIIKTSGAKHWMN